MSTTENNLFKMVNVIEAASILGVKAWTIRQRVSRRKIPFYRVGRLVRFKVSEFERWVDANKVDEKVA
jgi:excisionase family DNA binding protein